MTAQLIFDLCQRFPMCRGAVWMRMMALQVMERYRNDDPRECDCYGFEETSQWECN
jgi:hypothetical protein